MPIKKYGYQFPMGTNEVTMELHAFLNDRGPEYGGLGQFEHFRNAADLLWNDPQKPTSRNFIWTYPGKTLTENSIAVLPELNNDNSITMLPKKVLGICSDFIVYYKEYW